ASGVGFNGLRGALDDGIVAFGAFTCAVDGQRRFIRLVYVGEDVSGMKRGKAALHKNAVFNLLEGAVADIDLSGLAEVTMDTVAEKIRAATRAGDVQLS
ncbi:unnamed protein product, partial [Phaeothamnion confervicola]